MLVLIRAVVGQQPAAGQDEKHQEEALRARVPDQEGVRKNSEEELEMALAQDVDQRRPGDDSYWPPSSVLDLANVQFHQRLAQRVSQPTPH